MGGPGLWAAREQLRNVASYVSPRSCTVVPHLINEKKHMTSMDALTSHSLLLNVFSAHIGILRRRRGRGSRSRRGVAVRLRPYCAHSPAGAERLRNRGCR